MKKFIPSRKRGWTAAVFIVCVLVFSFVSFGPKSEASDVKDWPYNQSSAEEISLSDAWAHVDLKSSEGSDHIKVGILDDYVYIRLQDATTVRAKIPYPSTGIIADFVKFSSADLQIYKNTSFKASLSDRLFQLLPIFLIVSLLVYMLARGATKSLGLTSSYEIVDVKDLHEGFDDVAGIQNARSEVEEIVQFLKNPSKISKVGARMPKGALFAGPPGTGKTLLARALAKEAGVPFITIDASSINQIFVGAGAMKLRSAFSAARKLGSCIIFIDEIDAMGKARGGTGPGGSSDEKETTLNTLLVEMDGFDTSKGVFIIAATNRPEVLDPALTRSGRFDRQVDILPPDAKGRTEIIEVHLSKIKTDSTVDAEQLARTTYGFTGADLALLVNEAAILAALRDSKAASLGDFTQARDRMILGRSSSNRMLSDQEKKITAVHEAGHALIAYLREDADPIEKVTIVPTGRSLGFVMQSPNADKLIETKSQLEARLDVAVAGRVAEQLSLGMDSITTGAQSDIEIATKIARSMVEKWGMSKCGFVSIVDNLDPMHRGNPSSSSEVRDIISASIDRVTKDMVRRKAAIQRISKALIQEETLSKEDIENLVRNKKRLT